MKWINVPGLDDHGFVVGFPRRSYLSIPNSRDVYSVVRKAPKPSPKSLLQFLHFLEMFQIGILDPKTETCRQKSTLPPRQLIFEYKMCPKVINSFFALLCSYFILDEFFGKKTEVPGLDKKGENFQFINPDLFLHFLFKKITWAFLHTNTLSSELKFRPNCRLDFKLCRKGTLTNFHSLIAAKLFIQFFSFLKKTAHGTLNVNLMEGFQPTLSYFWLISIGTFKPWCSAGLDDQENDPWIRRCAWLWRF